MSEENWQKMSEEELKESFQKNLKAADYYKLTSEYFLTDLKIYTEILLSFIRDVVKSGRFAGEKLLEIGSGATVHNIASASAYYPIIVQSDFVDDNCEALKCWHKKESPLDWSEFLKLVAKLEDFRSDEKEVVSRLESRIRNSVKAVVHCDTLVDGIIRLEDVPDIAHPPYDLIISIYCLEVPCRDFESFVNSLKRIHKLLRKGGGLIFASLFNMHKWSLENVQYPHLKLEVKDVILAVDRAGFGNLEIKSFSKVYTRYEEDFAGLYCVSCEKI